ncbi:hypothetical protein CRE_04510 [Caenorhabditis remanei]|uniref:DUF38 domain-containing protein n=1 Tax=Caenorhabditis remanei TaxID=31234 RepID=E3LYS0_CAERE|nr:hypothetical protein CRE_04510 [Caenorhabditis remanei]
MPSHARNLRLYISIALLIFLFFARQRSLNVIFEEREMSQFVNETDKLLSPFDLEVAKWKTCMQNNMEKDQVTWFLTRFAVTKCRNETQFSKVPVAKTMTKNEIMKGVPSYNMFINSTKEPYTVVTIGNISREETKKQLVDNLPKDSKFFGTHWNSSQIFSEYQKLEEYLNSSNNTNIIHLSDYLETLSGVKIIDLVGASLSKTILNSVFFQLSIIYEISNFELFRELSNDGEIEREGLLICQIKLRVDYPDALKKEELIEVISTIILDARYLILSIHNLEIFMVNFDTPVCREKYLGPYII